MPAVIFETFLNADFHRCEAMGENQSALVDASSLASAWCLLALACCHLEDWQIVQSAV